MVVSRFIPYSHLILQVFNFVFFLGKGGILEYSENC